MLKKFSTHKGLLVFLGQITQLIQRKKVKTGKT
jgi:hypothetical protein